MRQPLPGRGFTLIELLVVISIIGILAGIVTISLAPARAKARDDQRRANLASLASALQNYYSQNKEYPPQAGGWADVDVLAGQLVPNFLSQIPTDPSFKKPYSFDQGGLVYQTNPAVVDGISRRPGSFFALDATLERSAVSDPLTPLEPTDSTKLNFFQTGFYQYPTSNGHLHYRVSSQ